MRKDETNKPLMEEPSYRSPTLYSLGNIGINDGVNAHEDNSEVVVMIEIPQTEEIRMSNQPPITTNNMATLHTPTPLINRQLIW